MPLFLPGPGPWVHSFGDRLASDRYHDAIVATSGLSSYWRLDEQSGTTAADSFDSSPGTYTGGFTLGAAGALAGIANTAVSLNGTTGWISLPATVPTFSGADATFECWMRTSDTTKNDQQLYSGYQNGGAFAGWGVMYNLAGSHKIGYYSSTLGSWVESTGTITDTLWHHVVVTVSSAGGVTFYIDGSATGTPTSAAPGNWTGTKGIGATQDGLVNFFKGDLDEAAVYGSVLSLATVQAHFIAGGGTLGGGAVNLDASGGTATASGSPATLTLVYTAASGTATTSGTVALARTVAAAAGTATATGGSVTLTAAYTAATATAVASGGTSTFAATYTAATGAATASGTTPTVTFVYLAATGGATAGGGTVNYFSGIVLVASTGTATAVGGTSTLAFTYTASTGTASATGGTATTARTLTAASGTATAGGGTATVSIGQLAISAVTGTASATGTTPVLTFVYAKGSGTGTATGGTVNFSATGGLSAIGGTATAAGGTSNLNVTWIAAGGAASATGGTVSRINPAAAGLANATGGATTLRFTYTAAAGLATATGGNSTASSATTRPRWPPHTDNHWDTDLQGRWDVDPQGDWLAAGAGTRWPYDTDTRWD